MSADGFSWVLLEEMVRVVLRRTNLVGRMGAAGRVSSSWTWRWRSLKAGSAWGTKGLQGKVRSCCLV